MCALQGIVGGPYMAFPDGADTPQSYADYAAMALNEGFTHYALDELEEGFKKYQSRAEPLPATVSNLAFTTALIETGIFPDVIESQIDKITDKTQREITRARWNQSRISISDPALIAMAGAMGVDEKTLTAIYTRATLLDQS